MSERSGIGQKYHKSIPSKVKDGLVDRMVSKECHLLFKIPPSSIRSQGAWMRTRSSILLFSLR